jgi:hypothetical protein
MPSVIGLLFKQKGTAAKKDRLEGRSFTFWILISSSERHLASCQAEREHASKAKQHHGPG